MAENAFFSPEQAALLKAILNRVIPPDGAMPGAGDLGAVEAIETALSGAPAARRLFLDGLAEVQLVAWRTTDQEFVALGASEQDAILKAVETARSDFFAQLVHHAYRAYYVHPTVVRALGLDPRPPQPLGHSLPSFDPALLDRVRARGPIYRRT